MKVVVGKAMSRGSMKSGHVAEDGAGDPQEECGNRPCRAFVSARVQAHSFGLFFIVADCIDRQAEVRGVEPPQKNKHDEGKTEQQEIKEKLLRIRRARKYWHRNSRGGADPFPGSHQFGARNGHAERADGEIRTAQAKYDPGCCHREQGGGDAPRYRPQSETGEVLGCGENDVGGASAGRIHANVVEQADLHHRRCVHTGAKEEDVPK